ncbi:unnamed protein product, partial [Didymodactylos carnosus]
HLNEKYVSLTIDDFPNINDLNVSIQILDILKKYDAHCTFFTIGSHVLKYEANLIDDLFKRISVENHELGNHGWRDEMALKLSKFELEKQINDTHTVITKNKHFNHKNLWNWFRPGHGYFNSTILEVCKKLNHKLVLGSIYPYDPQLKYSRWNSSFIKYKLYSGAIIILHDRLATVRTLELVLPEIIKQNYQIVTLTKLYQLSKTSLRPD